MRTLNSPNRARENSLSAPETVSIWDRSMRLLGDYMPYGSLAISVLLGLIQSGVSWFFDGTTLLLTLLAAVWIAVTFTRAPRAQPARSRWMLLYYAGFLLLTAVLMARQPNYFVFAISGFLNAAELRPWPLVFLGVGLTSIFVNTIITGFPWPAFESWLIFGTIIIIQTFTISFGVLLNEKVLQLSEQRRQALERLEAAMQENAGLQAQLLAQAREAGVLDERQRLAREIHDTLAQGLIGIITQLAALQQVQDQPASAGRHLEHALQLARSSLVEARRSVHALRPAALLSAQLPEALADLARRWSVLNGVAVEFQSTGELLELPAEAEDALLRMAQEALANIARHAQATRVGLTISYMDDEVTLDVRDDGIGFQPDATALGPRAGFGLTAMQQRLSRLGGRLVIESEPGAGTAISACLPVALQEQTNNESAPLTDR